MEDNNNTGEVNESNAVKGENSSQESNFPSPAEISSKLNELLWDDVAEPQAEADEAVSNQSEVQQSDDEPQEADQEDTEGKEVHSQSEEEQQEDSRGVQKRIDKLTAKRKEAEAEIEKLRAEVETLKNATPAPKERELPDDPYSNLNTIAEIEAEIAQARSVRNWAEENADGFTHTNEQGEEEYFDAAKMRQIKVNAMKAIEEGLPKRFQYLQARDQLDQVVVKEYPWWNDKTAKERQIAEQFLKSFPAIKKFPDYKMVIGDYIRGVKSREAAFKGQKPIVKAPVQPRSSGVAPTVKKEDVRSQNAYAKFVKTNRTDDLANVMNKFLD
jgi:chromosome segregation ATPase